VTLVVIIFRERGLLRCFFGNTLYPFLCCCIRDCLFFELNNFRILKLFWHSHSPSHHDEPRPRRLLVSFARPLTRWAIRTLILQKWFLLHSLLPGDMNKLISKQCAVPRAASFLCIEIHCIIRADCDARPAPFFLKRWPMALHIYPEFPDTFWSFKRALKVVGKLTDN